jgi:hypothetical protein
MKTSGVILIALICGLLGFFIGILVPPAEREAASPSPAEAQSTPEATEPQEKPPRQTTSYQRPAKLTASEQAELVRLKKRVGELEAKAAFQEAVVEGYRQDKYGTPIPWPDRIPGQYKQEEFQSIINQAIIEAEAPVDLVGFDCKEPPCIALLRRHDGRSSSGLAQTKIWKDNYGGSVRSGYSGFVDCGDGRKERIILESPYWDWKTDPKTLPPGAYDQQLRDKIKKGFVQTEEEKNRTKRMRARWDEILSNWRCLPAEPPP